MPSLAQPANDNASSAIDVTSLINASCTTGGYYTNVNATADVTSPAPSCWSSAPSHNVWFKFTATSTKFINFKVKVSGTGETMRYTMVALLNGGLSTVLQCQNQQGYGNGATDLSMSYYGLTQGNIYYIEVDDYTGWGNTGKFDICLSDVPDFDFSPGAVDLTSSINSACSSGGTYTNQYASSTADNYKGTCWSGGPNNNVWYKFTATSTSFVNFQVKVSGTGETMRYAMVALWDATLTTNYQCQNQQGYGNGASDLSMSYYGLTPGSTYYIEVDDYSNWGNTGKFDVCISDAPTFDYPQGAINLTSRINAGCTTGGTYTNQYATSDNNMPTCWSGGPSNNVWFKFTASSTTFINIQIKVSGTGETMRYPMVALMDASFSTVQCQNQQGYGNGAVDLSMSFYGLNPGSTYYIDVDDYSNWGNTGKFDICLSDVPDYDFPAGAIDVTSSINAACTTGGAYTNQYASATSDNHKGNCWSGGPNNNVWFKFTATATTFINFQVKVSGGGETMRYPMVALWDATITTNLQCQNQQGYGNGAVDLSMSYYGLTPGNTYYIEIDDYANWGNTGKYDICISDIPSFDYPQGAIDLTSSINAACTSGGTYTNQYATADHSAGTCWSSAPNSNQNVWFKFTATSTAFINIQVKVSGGGETMRYPMVALWNSTWTTNYQCQNQQGYGNGAVDLSMSYYGLSPGTTYYIEVDDYANWGNTGKFDICISDVPTFDYPQGAIDMTSSINAGCTLGGTYTNQYATADHSTGTCWSSNPNPNNNVWFKFTATSTTFINVQIKVSGTGETMRYPMVALWDAALATNYQCQNQQGYGNGAVDLSMSYYGLSPGTTYYIEVDDYANWGNTGKFDIGISDVVNFDYHQGAVDLTSSINKGCSAGGTYTNRYASIVGDNYKGNCWSGGPNNNVWFKFTASSTTFINIQVKVSNTGETIRYPMVALWDATLGTNIQCQNQQGYGNGAVDLSMSYYGLTPGSTYYIEVDDYANWGNTGAFDICISDQCDFDYPQGAIDLTSVMNGCSVGGTYTNQYATADHTTGTCWSSSPNANNNVWFKFTASSTTFINVQVKVSGSGETMRYPMVALWDAAITTNYQCQNQQGYGNGAVDLSMSFYGLTPGNIYYIEVDDYANWGNTGTFDICAYDQPDYDYPQGATILNNVNNYCSSGGTFSNTTATPDNHKGGCWSDGPNKNRWFKFQAITTSVTSSITVNSGETMRYPMMSLWASDFTNELACTNHQPYGSGASNISLTYTGLVVGTWYYISVDYYSAWGNGGTFDICINNASTVQYYSIASGDWSTNSTWSTTGFGGGSAGTIPSSGNIVNIQDKDIAVSSNQSCAQINMTTSSANTSLSVSNSTLTVYGTYNQTNSGTNKTMNTTVSTNGTLTVNNNIALTRSGGNTDFKFTINAGCTVNAGQDIILTSSSGTAINNTFQLNGSAILNITRDLNLTSTGGMLIDFNANNTSVVNIGRDLNFSSTAAGKLSITLNNSAALNIKRSITRGATPYGIMNFNNSSTITFNGTSNQQIMPATAGTGGDNINYNNVVLSNNSGYTADVTLGGNVTVAGDITVTGNTGFADGGFQITGSSGKTFTLASNSIYTSTRTSDPCFPTLMNYNLNSGSNVYISGNGSFTLTAQPSSFGNLTFNSSGASTKTLKASTNITINGNLTIASNNTLADNGNTITLANDITNSGTHSGSGEMLFSGDLNIHYINSGIFGTGVFGNIEINDAPGAILSSNTIISGYLLLTLGTFQSGNFNISIGGNWINNTSFTQGTSTVTFNGTNTQSITGSGGTTFYNLTINRNTSTNALTIGSTINTGISFITTNSFTWTGHSDKIIIGATQGNQTVTLPSSLIIPSGSTLQFNATLPNSLNVPGNLTNSGTYTYGMETVTLDGTSSQNITSNNSTFYSLVMNNSAGVQLKDNLSLANNLTLSNGIVQTSSSTVLTLLNGATTTLGGPSSYINGPMKYNVAASGSTSLNFPIGKSISWRPFILQVNHSNATSVTYTGEVFNLSASDLGYGLPSTISQVSGFRYWQIDRTAVANLNNATVQLYYDSDDGVTDFTNLTVAKTTGSSSPWIDIGGTATGNTTGNILSGTFTSFSKFALANKKGGGNALPIKLLYFNAQSNGSSTLPTVICNWTTISELDNNYFTVERSADAKSFIEVGKVKGASYSNQPLNYSLTDENPFTGLSYYRLKQTDFNGASSYSSLVPVIISTENDFFNIYPNPTSENSIIFDTKVLGQKEINIYNTQGQVVLHLDFSQDKSIIDISTLSKGIYYVNLKYSEGSLNKKLVKE